ncbi:MAG: hypothetical protein IJD33_03935 [Clostridia bacterium]|nr:hypothetical protein [Clostridia bacterium]
MKIDIISYTDAQFAELSEEQILQVQQAQLKKERLDIRLEEEILKEKHRLIENGIFLSPIWELYKAKKQEEHDLEVETLREALLFHLQFSAKPSGDLSTEGYRLDYSLSIEERYEYVRSFYIEKYGEDTAGRFEAFDTDTQAMQYLGEKYSVLYDYFWSSR